MMWVIKNLCGWFYKNDGFVVWARTRSTLLILNVTTNVFVEISLVWSMINNNTYNFAQRMIGYQSRHVTVLV